MFRASKPSDALPALRQKGRVAEFDGFEVWAHNAASTGRDRAAHRHYLPRHLFQKAHAGLVPVAARMHQCFHTQAVLQAQVSPRKSRTSRLAPLSANICRHEFLPLKAACVTAVHPRLSQAFNAVSRRKRNFTQAS
eukprot:CAMPEP_0115735356 /NCGR_PEP_ID=MMETSP0272-20121206/86675_1 /TAXON_ID=71861 /ORGANISM="Scrippsiella trochoidea, Strain CCMP3099" /LENGTH=135 /DNA_ID=CAMNT_0003179455 /DNA_START=554 /DNA_END=961 /DNA_ORIENTATION=-